MFFLIFFNFAYDWKLKNNFQIKNFMKSGISKSMLFTFLIVTGVETDV